MYAQTESCFTVTEYAIEKDVATDTEGEVDIAEEDTINTGMDGIKRIKKRPIWILDYVV